MFIFSLCGPCEYSEGRKQVPIKNTVGPIGGFPNPTPEGQDGLQKQNPGEPSGFEFWSSPWGLPNPDGPFGGCIGGPKRINFWRI